GWAASTVIRSTSGIRRRSPAGPPLYRLAVMESSTRNTSNTGDMPTPHRTACSNWLRGTVLTRVTPALSTQVKATARTPAAARSSVYAMAESYAVDTAVSRVGRRVADGGTWVFLSPHEQERLLIHVAADVATKRRERGLRLNYPEAVAVLSAFLLE